jgi:hypothetical protein
MKKYLTPQIECIYLAEDVIRTSREGFFEDAKDDPWIIFWGSPTSWNDAF